MLPSSLKTGTTTETAGAVVASFITAAFCNDGREKPARSARVRQTDRAGLSLSVRPIQTRPEHCATGPWSNCGSGVRCGLRKDLRLFVRSKFHRAIGRAGPARPRIDRNGAITRTDLSGLAIQPGKPADAPALQ